MTTDPLISDTPVYWYLIEAEAPYRRPVRLEVHPLPTEDPDTTEGRALRLACRYKDLGYRITGQTRFRIPD